MTSPIPSKGRILIADDEETFGAGLCDALVREGYECKSVIDGGSVAAELHTSQPYDVLISDIRMPGNANLQLIHHLPEIAEALPVILVTAYPDFSGALRSAELPVLAYLAKPVPFAELLQHVRRGVRFSALYRANKELTQRLTARLAELKVHDQLLSGGAGKSAVSVDAFALDSMRHALTCLSDLRAMWERASANRTAASPSDEVIDQAIAGAISALQPALCASQGDGSAPARDHRHEDMIKPLHAFTPAKSSNQFST